jgi:hypothetical protein
MAMSRKTVGRYQTIVAISDSFHQPKMYERIYKKIGDELGGFPGIWLFVALMADVFIEYEEKGGVDWDKYEFIDSVWRYVERVQRDLLDDNLRPASPGTAGEEGVRKALESILRQSLIKV